MTTEPPSDLPVYSDEPRLLERPGDEGGPAISVRGLTKIFSKSRGPNPEPALKDIDLDVRVGEFLVLLGPSGCGKTTLMRCIAGLERPTSGLIRIGQETVFDSAGRVDRLKRPVSMIFQSYALWPHMTAYRHVAFPLQCAGVKRAEIPGRVSEILEKVDIGHLADRFPGQMSGGQQQRLAFARALVVGQQVMLMDEPLSNVDAQVRERLRLELIKMQRTLGFTAIYVTHDQSEAMELGDRIAVMARGRIAQMGTPAEVYSRPDNLAVARVLGQTNEVPFLVERLESATSTIIGKSDAGRVVATYVSGGDDAPPAAGDELIAFGRPRDFFISSKGVDGPSAATEVNSWPARIEAIRFLGSHTEYVVKINEIRMRCRLGPGVSELAEGDDVTVGVAADALRASPRP